MPCLLAVIVLAFPRVVLVLMWLFSNVLQRAYHNMIVPLLGLIFLPITTIVYAWLVTNHLRLDGLNLFILIVAVVLDAGSHGGSWRSYKT